MQVEALAESLQSYQPRPRPLVMSLAWLSTASPDLVDCCGRSGRLAGIRRPSMVALAYGEDGLIWLGHDRRDD